MLQQMEDDITTILLASQNGAEDVPPIIELPPDPTIDADEATHTDLQNPLGFLAKMALDQPEEPQQPGPSKYWSGKSTACQSLQ